MAFKTIRFRDKDLDFQCKVTINTDGIFTTYLPADIVMQLEAVGIRCAANPDHRIRTGYYSDATLAGLKAHIGEVLAEYNSSKIIESRLVIRYCIETTCAYCVNDAGDIVPNGSSEWNDGKEGYSWESGTRDQHAAYPQPYGIRVWAAVFRKEVRECRSGKKHTEYERLTTNGLEQENIAGAPYHLASFSAIRPPNEDIQEVDCTEENAAFFGNMLTSICALNEKLKDKLDPKSITKMIESRQKLLGESSPNKPNSQSGD